MEPSSGGETSGAEFNTVYVQGLLEEARGQLQRGPSTLKIKTAIRKMLDLVAPPATPPSAMKKKKPPADENVTITVECHVCGQERPASFFKRGFKCNDCRGHHGNELGTPQSSSASLVPSVTLPSKFYFAPLEKLVASSCAAALGEDIDPVVPPSVKYTVLRVPFEPGMESKVKVARIKLSHPNIACIFASCIDRKRNEVCYVHETAVPILDSAQVVADSIPNSSFASTFSSFSAVKWSREPSSSTLSGSSTSAEAVYERMKKIVLSVLHGLAFLHQNGFTHNDLRPHNIVVDAHQNVKIRYATFPDRPLPPPFAPPEVEGIAAPRATKEGDIYTLGVSLSIIAFGAALEFPEEHQQTPDDAQLINLITQMTAAVPAERCSIAKALATNYLSSVRFVNGLPVETQIAHVGVAESSPHSYIVAGEVPTPETKDLLQFFAEHGPAFQIIRGPTHVSLYSVKSDPRRKRAKTIVESSPMSSQRMRSATLPPK